MRGDGRIFQRGRRWWIAYYVRRAGKSVEIRERAGATEKEAERLLRQRRKEKAAAELGLQAFLGPQADRVTVDALLDNLLQQYAVEQRDQRRAASHMRHLRAFFGLERAASVTGGTLTQYIALRQSQGAAAGTINRELRILRRAYRLAVAQTMLGQHHVPVFALLPEHNAREGFVERGDFQRIVSHLKDQSLRDFVSWAFLTGMRRGAIAALTWAAFDKETWTLRLHAKDDKARKGVVIPLEGELREIIRRRLAMRRLDCPLIFHRQGQPIRSFRKAWKHATQAAGVPGLRVHDLRRSAVRNMIRAGVDPAVAMRISGHRTRAIFDRYNIVDERDLREAILKTQAYLDHPVPAGTMVAPHS